MSCSVKVDLARCERRPGIALTTLVTLPFGASLAGAITFGADLTAPSNNPATCSDLFANSCTLLSGAPGPGFYAPLSGTVTAVRVRTGPFQQGPMQTLVMRSL